MDLDITLDDELEFGEDDSSEILEPSADSELHPEEPSISDDMNWYHKMVEIIKNKANDDTMDDHFYQTLINNKLSQIACSMRCKFEFHDGGLIPANFYSFLLATSGSGKGRTNSTLEELFFKEFNEQFKSLFAERSRINIGLLAEQKALREGMDESTAETAINRRFQDLPPYEPSYNDATEAGLKSIREKLTLASVGSTNIELDELGINMSKVQEFLSAILEVYDTGKLKTKLTKMDASTGSEPIPATFLSFGTGSTLLDGAEKEKHFNEMLRQGMARRCCISYTDEIAVVDDETEDNFDPLEILGRSRSAEDFSDGKHISHKILGLCRDTNLYRTLTIPTAIWAKILRYEHECKREAAKLSEFDDLVRLNTVHSYWAMTKLMAVLAFIDGATEVGEIHYDIAHKYILESRRQFNEMVKRKSNFERIANFICTAKRELTLFDLTDALPFYKAGTKQSKQEMLDLAESYAATHNMVIKHTLKEGIDYYSGSRLAEVNLDKITLSKSTDITENYAPLEGAFNTLHMLTGMSCCYSAHRFTEGTNKSGVVVPGYRNADNAIPGFNIVILDVDEGCDITTAKAILEGQKYLISTTKSHQVNKNGVVCDRFRIILPLKYELKMEAEEFKQFMTNVMSEFPIPVDPACKDISRFYYGNPKAEHFYGEGTMYDPTDCIPDTETNKRRVATNQKLGDIGGLERFFLKKISIGERNNEFIKFAMALVDSDEEYEMIEDRVYALNQKLDDPLPVKELSSTVLSTVRKKIYRGGN